MKKVLVVLMIVGLFILGSSAFVKAPLNGNGNGTCTTIQDGTLLTSDGLLIKPGFDEWGYNYQAHLFNGKYCDAYHDAAWCQAWKEDDLSMKWNDAWISNMDCDGDSKLDRHYGFPSYIGSGAWLTNHMKGVYEYEGDTCIWEYFVKIVAAPVDGYIENGYWYTADGNMIGYEIWGEFAVIQEVSNDPCMGIHGIQFLSPDHAGFGGW